MTAPELIGLAAGGWLAAGLTAVVAVGQSLRADRLGLRVAEAAHELRGPLCAARLALHALERALSPAPAPTRDIAAVDSELRRAGSTLDDLSALLTDRERVRTAGWGPPREPLDVRAFLEAAEPAWRAVAQAHGKSLQVNAAGGQAVACAGAWQLARALGNLVANAANTGPDKSP